MNWSIAEIVRAVKRTLSEALGESIRRLRTEHQLTQVEFAELAGFHQAYVSRLEGGNANPTLNALEVVATSLGLTIFELFEAARSEMGVARRAGVRARGRPREGRPRKRL